jgi:hypothetical protein
LRVRRACGSGRHDEVNDNAESIIFSGHQSKNCRATRWFVRIAAFYGRYQWDKDVTRNFAGVENH